MRALRAHEHRSAALLLALLVLAYLWPALIEGRLLSPLAQLWGSHPWQTSAPRGIGRWINGDMGDVPVTYYPWDVLARRFIHAGTFPAWNPYAFAGTPLFANSQIAWLSPFSLPLWILPLNYALGVAAALKLWMAGFGTYLLARELRLSFLPALVAGTAFALCSFNVVWLTYGVFVSVAAMLPWAIWLTERIVRDGRGGDGLALVAVLAAALLGGHPGTQLHLLAAVALYAVVRSLTVTGVAWRERGLRLALLGASTITALLLAAVVLLPAERAAADTIGALMRRDGAPSFRSAQMPAGVLRTALFPDWWGRPGNALLSDGPGAYRERTFYAGAATLVLAFVALASAGGWRRKAPFAVLGLLGLAVAVRTPPLYEVVISLPAFDRIQNARIYLWFTLAAAVLAAFGLQAVLDARGRLGRAWLAPAAGLLAGLATAAALVAGGVSWPAVRHALLHRPATGAHDALALASVLWWLIPVAALVAALWLARSARHRQAAVVGIALLAAFDLLHFASGYQPIGPADRVIPPRTPAIAYLERHRHEGRIVGVQALTADWSTLYRLHDVRGSDEPAPSLRYHQLMLLANPTREYPTDLNGVSAQGPRVLGLLGVRYLLLTPRTSGSSRGLRVVYAARDGKVYKNRFAAPRAFVASTTRVAASEDEELATVAEDGFDPRYGAVVRADELDGQALPGASSGSAAVVREDNSSVTLQATLAQPGIVVLGDAWAPGWSVEVDGRPARPLQANVVLRGVAVPAGTHRIAWRYRVPGLRAGAALSAVGLLVVLGWAVALARLRSRARTSRPRSSDPATTAA
ncbi:MAG TPA: YfhO family protein [Conexibacter sp.]|nr:YfhO family protein [Conexibacter sp.]